MTGATALLALLVLIVPAKAFVAIGLARVPSTRPAASRPISSMSTAMAEAPVKPMSARRLAKTRAREAREARLRAAQGVDTSAAPVSRITSHDEYLRALAENENSLVIVKFFAPWCRSCKAMDVKYRRLAVENKDVKFFEIDAAESPQLKQALGVTAVPTVKMYAGAIGQVASFTCGPRKVPELERKMNRCKNVSALAARVSRGSGMIEMVSEAEESETPGGGIVKGLMEKFARQEKLARALADAQMNELPLFPAV